MSRQKLSQMGAGLSAAGERPGFSLSIAPGGGTITPVLGPRDGSLVVLALPRNLPLSHATSVSGCVAAPPGQLRAAFHFREAQMGKKLYVGNLTYEVTDTDLDKLCGEFGTVRSAQVIMDRDTARSKGFGFVEMT